jgi:hypothetical protein
MDSLFTLLNASFLRLLSRSQKAMLFVDREERLNSNNKNGPCTPARVHIFPLVLVSLFTLFVGMWMLRSHKLIWVFFTWLRKSNHHPVRHLSAEAQFSAKK